MFPTFRCILSVVHNDSKSNLKYNRRFDYKKFNCSKLERNLRHRSVTNCFNSSNNSNSKARTS